MNADISPKYATRTTIIRRVRGRLAKPLTREAELAAIAAFIARNGVRRVTIESDGAVRLQIVPS